MKNRYAKAFLCAFWGSILQAGTVFGATTYYVSAATGSNSNPGTSSLPFLTIQKAADTMDAGDTCIIRTGVYREKVTVYDSNVTFQAASGESVVICGTNPVQDWTHVSGNIYRATMPAEWSSLGNRNQFFQGVGWLLTGLKMRPEARWPNAGSNYPWEDSRLAHPTNSELGTWSYLDSAGYDSQGKNGWFTDNQLPAINWNACMKHIPARW